MAKPSRSPLVGYNHNISHLGRVFHVQTEDSGPASPRLFTHMFHEGTILASVKHEYDAASPEDKVRLLMQNQHKAMIRDLVHAKFDDKLVAFFRARGQELPATTGALPSTPMLDTPVPLVSPEAEEVSTTRAEAAGIEGETAHPPGASEAEPDRTDDPAAGASIPTVISARERETRPFVSQGRSAGAGATVSGGSGSTARASEPRRSPFVRNVNLVVGGPTTAPASVEVSSAGGAARATRANGATRSGGGPLGKRESNDGVVVQRTVRVGGSGGIAASGRSQRVRRPAAPFVVLGGGGGDLGARQGGAELESLPPPVEDAGRHTSLHVAALGAGGAQGAMVSEPPAADPPQLSDGGTTDR
jgi:hypothetical protein